MGKLSFQTKVIALTSALIAVICIASILLFISFYSSNERIRLQHDLEVQLDFKSEVLAKPLWGLDREEVERFLQVMNGNDQIAYIGVWTSWGDETELFAERLAVSLERQTELNTLQRQFVSMVSHEFRTPIAIIDSVAGRLKKEAPAHDPEKLLSRIETIRGAIVRMIQLIDSALSASSLDEGKVAFKLEPCDIRALIEEVHENLATAKASHRHEVDLDILPARISGDPKLLHQVFSNLVSNAMKYSPDGSMITIEGWRDEASVYVSVKDQGVGIPKSEIGNLFQRFFRASTSAGIAGTGIGLYVVKSFVEMHGGSIAVESVENDGTRFTVKLPIGDDADPAPASDETDLLKTLVEIDESMFSGV